MKEIKIIGRIDSFLSNRAHNGEPCRVQGPRIEGKYRDRRTKNTYSRYALYAGDKCIWRGHRVLDCLYSLEALPAKRELQRKPATIVMRVTARERALLLQHREKHE